MSDTQYKAEVLSKPYIYYHYTSEKMIMNKNVFLVQLNNSYRVK